MPAEIAAQRRVERGEIVDRFEAEDIAFMKAVRQGYLSIAKQFPTRCRVIDATQSVEEMAATISQQIQSLE